MFNRSWYLTRCCELEVPNPTQTLKLVKGMGYTFDLSTKWARTLSSERIFRLKFSMGYLKRPPQYFFFNRSWHLTPCWWLEVQKLSQALMLVKYLWLKSQLGKNCAIWNLQWDNQRTPPPNFLKNLIEVDISHPAVDLRCRNLHWPLSQLKAWTMPLT